MEGFFEDLTSGLKDFGSFVLDLIKDIFSNVPKIINFALWVFAGVFVLPCVFMAGVIYPLWEKWGEDF